MVRKQRLMEGEAADFFLLPPEVQECRDAQPAVDRYFQPLFRKQTSTKWGIDGKADRMCRCTASSSKSTVEENTAENPEGGGALFPTDVAEQYPARDDDEHNDQPVGQEHGRRTAGPYRGWGPKLAQPSRYLQQPASLPRPRCSLLTSEGPSSRFDSSGAVRVVHTVYASGPASGACVMTLSRSAALLPQCMAGSSASQSMVSSAFAPRLASSRSAQSIGMRYEIEPVMATDVRQWAGVRADEQDLNPRMDPRNLASTRSFSATSMGAGSDAGLHDHAHQTTILGPRRSRPRLLVTGRPGAGLFRPPGTPYQQPAHYSTLHPYLQPTICAVQARSCAIGKAVEPTRSSRASASTSSRAAPPPPVNQPVKRMASVGRIKKVPSSFSLV